MSINMSSSSSGSCREKFCLRLPGMRHSQSVAITYPHVTPATHSRAGRFPPKSERQKRLVASTQRAGPSQLPIQFCFFVSHHIRHLHLCTPLSIPGTPSALPFCFSVFRVCSHITEPRSISALELSRTRGGRCLDLGASFIRREAKWLPLSTTINSRPFHHEAAIALIA
jgi:hypothetical protein